MDAAEMLNQITIPTPCHVDWDSMRGDGRKRYCASCGEHVYNLSAMNAGEMVDLIRAQDGEFCGQFYRRPDGSVVTADCPPKPQPARGPWQYHLRSLMALIAGCAATLGFARLFAEDPSAATAAQALVPVKTGLNHLGGMVALPRTLIQPNGEGPCDNPPPD
jgi:hypothetical protein